jgi:hypothetical protein
MRRLALTTTAALVAGGCTFADVTPPLALAPPKERPKVLVLGDVKVESIER